MTQEERNLLLRDLCARLPYGVACEIHAKYYTGTQWEDSKTIIDVLDGRMIYSFSQPFAEFDTKEDYISSIKPYLRPMSSMTEEERKEYKSYQYHFSSNNLPDYEGDFVFVNEAHELIDWLNAHHFDYRGLIPLGLAIAVTEQNNPYKD